jgi:hypothetical protein
MKGLYPPSTLPGRLGHLVALGFASCVRERSRARRATSSLRDLGAWKGFAAPQTLGSQKWEPTCSAALGRSTTQPDSSRRSLAPSSTQSDGDRHPELPWNSLTRKRSLVQVQYDPRHFSKTCLALKGPRGASHLRFCSIIAGQSILTLQCEWKSFAGLACSVEDLSSCRGSHSGVGLYHGE